MGILHAAAARKQADSTQIRTTERPETTPQLTQSSSHRASDHEHPSQPQSRAAVDQKLPPAGGGRGAGAAPREGAQGEGDVKEHGLRKEKHQVLFFAKVKKWSVTGLGRGREARENFGGACMEAWVQRGRLHTRDRMLDSLHTASAAPRALTLTR